MKKLNGWHIYDPDGAFGSEELFENICNTLIDENMLEIKLESTEDETAYYRWRLTSMCNKITLYGNPGQELKITLSDKIQ